MRLKTNGAIAWLICGLAALFYVYDYFVQVSPAVITHQLMHSFSIGAAGLGVLGSCFFYTYAGVQIPAGALLDRFGARIVMAIAILISGLGVLFFATTTHFGVAAVGRLLIGFGSAFSFVGTLFLVAQWFAHRHFAFIAGLVQLAGCVGAIFGEVPLAAMMNHLGWRMGMLGIGIAAFILAAVFIIVIRDKPSNPQQPVSDPSYRIDHVLQVLKDSRVWWVAMLGFMSWIPVATVGALWGVPYLMTVFHMTNTQAAGLISLFWLSLGVASPLLGWLSDRIGRRKPIFYGCFTLGIAGALLLVLAPQISIFWVVIGILLLGLLPAIQSLTFAVVKDFLSPKAFGTAAGLVNMAPIVGGALAQVGIGFILDFFWNGHLHEGIPIYSIQTYQKGMILLVLAAAIGLMLTRFKLKETCPGPTT